MMHDKTQSKQDTKQDVMNQMPKELQPYERCYLYGAEVLNDAELLAVILRTGTTGMSSVILSNMLLCHYKNQGLTFLYHTSVQQLTKIKGIGKVKAVQLLCIGELSKRIAKVQARADLELNNPKSIADYYMEDMKYQNKEQIIIMFLNTKYSLIADMIISQGTVNASIITPREVYLEALRHEAVHIIMLHNHPSGDPTPSKEDFILTKRMSEAGKLLGISLDDHLIIGNNTYYSFSEHNALN